jgi:hypothetical protein
MTDQQATPTQEAYDPNKQDALFQKGYAAGVKAVQSDPKTFGSERNTPNEAGFSMNMYLSNEIMGRVQFTFRGVTSAEWGIVLEDVDRFSHYMRDKGWKFDGEIKLPSASAPAVSAPVRIAMEEGNKPLAQATANAELDVPAPPAGKEWIVFAASIVKVLPQPDNKVTLEFYAEGQKYPGVKVNKWKVENANGLMKHVTSEDMGKAAEYKLQCQVYYTEGAEGKTADGKVFHWKDVSHVRPFPF